MHVIRASVQIVLCLVAVMSAAAAGLLPSHKDRMFAYPATLAESDQGGFRVVDYRESRDIDSRDQVPERRVRSAFVDMRAGRATVEMRTDTPSGPARHFLTGQPAGATMITVYVHGRGGEGSQGANDWTFGGNFNRIKMLMLKAGGIYLSPDAGDFSASAIERLVALILHYRAAARPGAPVILACGSAGGAVCNAMARDPRIAPSLGGVLLLGSYWDEEWPQTAAGRAQVPVYIGHGSRDSVFPVATMEQHYRRLRDAGIPVRMVRFETGTHGTPIRMIDWREAINWMLTTR